MPTLIGTSCAQIFEPPWLTALPALDEIGKVDRALRQQPAAA